jgi:hypothetical protein
MNELFSDTQQSRNLSRKVFLKQFNKTPAQAYKEAEKIILLNRVKPSVFVPQYKPKYCAENYKIQTDLIERKNKLKWTNREIANIIKQSPGVASSKLNGFLILKPEERTLIEQAFTKAEKEALL